MIYCKKAETLHATLDSQVPISWTFAPGGRLSYEAYKVTKNINAECQTKEYKGMFNKRGH